MCDDAPQGTACAPSPDTTSTASRWRLNAMTDDHTTNLVIGNVTILRDKYGRYSLNTLYRASGSIKDKEPSEWSRIKSSQELIHEANSQTAYLRFEVVKGGNAPGTYAEKRLAIAYAAWI